MSADTAAVCGKCRRKPIVTEMDDVPPPEAFDAAAAELEVRRPSRWRRWLQIALTLVVVAALVVLAAVQGQLMVVRGDLPPGPFGNGRLVVVGEGGPLVAMRADGAVSMSFGTAGAPFEFPAWSPDGQRIAAIGRSAEAIGLYVHTPGNGQDPAPEPAVVYESAENPPFYLYWTPDSRQITFLTTESDGIALRIVAADGGAPAAILRNGAPMYWDFVDESRLFVHTGNVGPDEFLGEVGPDGATQPGTEAPGGYFRAPTVSADGRLRAYIRTDEDGAGSVRLEVRDGSSTTEVAAFGPAALSFAPQGDQLAFISPEGGNVPLPVGPLRLLQPGDTAARVIADDRFVAFFWAPSARTIGALRLPDPDDPVTQASTSGAALASTRTQPAAAGIPLWLDFIDVDTGFVAGHQPVRVSDLFVNQVLPFFDQYALSHRFWSPDSSAMVLPLVDQNDRTLVSAIPADGSAIRIVAAGSIGFWRP